MSSLLTTTKVLKPNAKVNLYQEARPLGRYPEISAPVVHHHRGTGRYQAVKKIRKVWWSYSRGRKVPADIYYVVVELAGRTPGSVGADLILLDLPGRGSSFFLAPAAAKVLPYRAQKNRSR